MGKPLYLIRFTDKVDGDDPYRYFTEEIHEDFTVADIYAYSDEHLLDLMEVLLQHPLGMWYWVMDLRYDSMIVSGACDQDDLIMIVDYLESIKNDA